MKDLKGNTRAGRSGKIIYLPSAKRLKYFEETKYGVITRMALLTLISGREEKI